MPVGKTAQKTRSVPDKLLGVRGAYLPRIWNKENILRKSTVLIKVSKREILQKKTVYTCAVHKHMQIAKKYGKDIQARSKQKVLKQDTIFFISAGSDFKFASQ